MFVKWLTPLTRLMGQSGMIYLAILSFIYFIPKLRTTGKYDYVYVLHFCIYNYKYVK